MKLSKTNEGVHLPTFCKVLCQAAGKNLISLRLVGGHAGNAELKDPRQTNGQMALAKTASKIVNPWVEPGGVLFEGHGKSCLEPPIFPRARNTLHTSRVNASRPVVVVGLRIGREEWHWILACVGALKINHACDGC